MSQESKHIKKQIKLQRSSDFGTLTIDDSWKIIEADESALKLTGYKRERLIGESIAFLINSIDADNSFEKISSKNSTGNNTGVYHLMTKKDGTFFWAKFTKKEADSNDNTVWIFCKISHGSRTENAIKNIISKIYEKTDISFMDNMALQLAKALNADHTFIGEIQNSKLSVKTLSHCVDGKIAEGFEYNLKNTPCEMVYTGNFSIYPQDITKLFPQDQDLIDLNIEGYAGIPLFDSKNRTLGLVVALYRHKIKDPLFTESIISLFANQIANEYERGKSEEKIHEQTTFYQSVIDNLKDRVMVIDKEYNIILTNKATREHSSIPMKNLQNLQKFKCYELAHNRSTKCDGKDHPCPFNEIVRTNKSVVIRHSHLNSKGKESPVELTCSPLWNQNGELIGIIESAKDITKQLKIEKKLKKQKEILSYQAHYDNLTKLPNRVLFLDRLSQSINNARRYNHQVAVLFIDIDNFKSINDSFGMSAGDKIIKASAKRLSTHIRQTDTLARLGGDEFAIAFASIEKTSSMIDLVNNIMELFKEPIVVKKHALHITVSIGISIYPNDSIKGKRLLKYADTAVHRAKDDGRNTYQFYAEEFTKKAFERVLMENSLRMALKNREFLVYYQPQIDGETDELIGMEALIRWQHPSMGTLLPVKFISLAEDIGLIIDIDLWVIKTAIEQVGSWRDSGHYAGTLSMNLSIKLLESKHFIHTLVSIAKNVKHFSSWIEFEVTESRIMDNPEHTISVLNKIKELGFSLSIDDFGTGYSSLSYLKRLPINKLKIDRSFIKDLPYDEDDIVITKTIIGLSKSLKLKVIAEGVETQEQKKLLIKDGCSHHQGFLYSKAISAEKMEEKIKIYKL